MPAIDVRHPALPELFDQGTPNLPMLFGILEGNLTGRAVADDAEHPVVVAVQGGDGIAFISRTTSWAAFEAALTELRRDAIVGLVRPADAGGPGFGVARPFGIHLYRQLEA